MWQCLQASCSSPRWISARQAEGFHHPLVLLRPTDTMKLPQIFHTSCVALSLVLSHIWGRLGLCAKKERSSFTLWGWRSRGYWDSTAYQNWAVAKLLPLQTNPELVSSSFFGLFISALLIKTEKNNESPSPWENGKAEGMIPKGRIPRTFFALCCASYFAASLWVLTEGEILLSRTPQDLLPKQ